MKSRALLTIPNRTLVAQGSTPKTFQTQQLEAVRDYLVKLERLQEPADHMRRIKNVNGQLAVSFKDGIMSARLGREVFRFSDVGASQVSRIVLPPRFFTGLKQLIRIEPDGDAVATEVWSRFASLQTKVQRVRTVRMKVGNEIHRVVRSCHSKDYAPYSNVEFVQDLLDSGEEFKNLPVLHWRVDDNGMRIRFLAINKVTTALGGLRPEIYDKEPIPMIEAWNSEVGLRRVGLRAGMWRIPCGNALGSWNDKAEASWIHRGKSMRIRQGVQAAHAGVVSEANLVVAAYHKARQVPIEDMLAWMRSKLQKDFCARVIANITEAAKDATTTPGETLASLIDAMTLAAQKETDIFAQYQIEQAAATLLHKALKEAEKNNNRLNRK